MVTIKDISKLSGYSITTVSKAINGYSDISEKTRDKILKICKDEGFIPSALGRNLSTKRTFTIGVVFSEETNQGLTHPFFAELLNELKNEIERYGYDILLIGNKVGDYVHSYLSHCQQKSVDGIVLLSSFDYESGIRELVDSDIPKVMLHAHFEKKACFFSDNRGAMHNLITYLKSLGHKDIGFVCGDLITFDGKERYEAFQYEMKQQGLTINEDWIFDGQYYTYEEGKLAIQKMLKLPKWPTVMVFSADTLAIGGMIEMLSHGYNIPEDLSITGFDNIAISNMFRPGLTTVNQNKKMLAKKAVESLLAQIDGKPYENKINLIPCDIIYRESVKKLN